MWCSRWWWSPAISPTISSLRRASLMLWCNASSPALWDRDSTFSSRRGWADSSVFYLHLFLLLSPSPCHCSISTWNVIFYHCVVHIDYIVKQVIENLHAHVHVRFLICTKKKVPVHLCKCACLKSSTVLKDMISALHTWTSGSSLWITEQLWFHILTLNCHSKFPFTTWPLMTLEWPFNLKMRSSISLTKFLIK